MINNKFIKNSFRLLSFSMILSSSLISSLNADTIELKSDQDYLVTYTRPGNIIVADLKENKIINNCRTDEKFSNGIVLSPDNKIAYILGDAGEDVAGYNIESCKKVFYTSLNEGDIQGKSNSGIAVSSDGKEIYAIYNRTKIGSDRYTVLDPMFSVYNLADGVNAKPIKSFKIPRRMSVISGAKDGSVYGLGSHFYNIDPKKGEVKIAKKMLDWEKTDLSNPDFFSPFITGQTLGQFSVLHVALKFKDEKKNMDEAVPYWGVTTVDLNTGNIDSHDAFTQFETVMFTSIRNPKDSNILYGVFNDLSKYDLKNNKLLKRVPVEHSYYNVMASADGKKLYLGSTLNDVAIYDADSLEKLGNIQLPEGDMGGATIQVFHTK